MNIKRYKRFLVQVFSLIILLIIFPVSAILAQVDHDAISEKIKNNIVKITSKILSDDIMGFGFVIGEQNGMLYIATARHVVMKYDKYEHKYDKATSVKVEFYNAKGKGKEIDNVTVLDLKSGNLDLSLLQVPKPEGYNIIDSYFSSDVKRGDKAWFIGLQPNWYVPANKGTISILSDDGEITFEISTIHVGTSGAPLLTEKGIVGLVTDDKQSIATGIYIKTIKDFVREHNYPLMEQPVTTIAEVTFEFAQSLSGQTNPDIKDIVSKISADALKELMDTGEASHRTKTEWWSDKKPALQELSSRGLVDLKVSVADSEGYDVHYEATDLGKKTYHSLQNIVIDVLARAKTQHSATPEIRAAVSTISPGALKLLIDTGEASHSTKTEWWSDKKPALEELSSRGLVDLKVGVADKKGYDVHYEATDLGKKTYHSLQNIVIDVLVRAKTQYYVDED